MIRQRHHGRLMNVHADALLNTIQNFSEFCKDHFAQFFVNAKLLREACGFDNRQRRANIIMQQI